MAKECFDCGAELTANTISRDTVDEHPICVECSAKRWDEFLAA